ncbi:SHNi-TPR-domain-containing protein [Lipomyces kononenkoae]|uniref:SHNi-TPR-domain-containing protein n=1 Tax=Lipomyces kononenkoae TaxID=34357 RepID=A0ACC3SX92_LIPKO
MSEASATGKINATGSLPKNGELERLTSAGLKSYGLKKYEDATESFARACEVFVIEHGRDDPNLLFLYGRALFQVAVSSSDVLGGVKTDNTKNSTSTPAGTQAASPKAESSGNGLFQFTGDAEDVDSEEDDEDHGEQEEENDFETAWEVLDLARTLFQKQVSSLSDAETNKETTRDTQQKLADIHDILGEISLESENFAQAATDLEASLKLKEELYAEESTFVSEARFKLSLALEFIPDRPDKRKQAAELVEKAINSVKRRIAISGEDDAGLLRDLEIRLHELQKVPTEGLSDGQAGDILGPTEAEIRDKIAAALTQANDISGLVRRKPVGTGASPAAASGPAAEAAEGSKRAGEAGEDDEARKKTKVGE